MCVLDLQMETTTAATEERHAMAASVTDVASATSILLAVCLVVLLTLIAICRLLRLPVFSSSSSGRGGCTDGAKCRRGDPLEDCACLPAAAKFPQDQSSTLSTSNQLHCSSRPYRPIVINLYLSTIARSP